MKIERIDVAQNGFVLYDNHNNLYIATNLTEMARLVGELPALGVATSTTYESGYTIAQLMEVRTRMRDGRKIDAIRLLRDCFTPRLGLREAKDLVETLCS